jgi:rod shape determining protein RodA
MFIGAMFVYSATMANQPAILPWYDQSWVRQIVWYALGSARARRCASWIITRWRAGRSWRIGATIFCLVAVLIPHIGTVHGWGARRWIDPGPFQFQPSEFAKLAFILAAANF